MKYKVGQRVRFKQEGKYDYDTIKLVHWTKEGPIIELSSGRIFDTRKETIKKFSGEDGEHEKP